MVKILLDAIELINSIECETEEEIDFKRKVVESLKLWDARNKKSVGRPGIKYPKNWKEVYASWRAKEITAKEAMIRTSMKRSSFYKLVKRYEKPVTA